MIVLSANGCTGAPSAPESMLTLRTSTSSCHPRPDHVAVAARPWPAVHNRHDHPMAQRHAWSARWRTARSAPMWDTCSRCGPGSAGRCGVWNMPTPTPTSGGCCVAARRAPGWPVVPRGRIRCQPVAGGRLLHHPTWQHFFSHALKQHTMESGKIPRLHERGSFRPPTPSATTPSPQPKSAHTPVRTGTVTPLVTTQELATAEYASSPVGDP